jgi:hypothetical protein
MRKIIKFFDKLEDHVREFLSKYPVVYSLIGATAIVIFWDGITRIMDSMDIFDGLGGGLLAVLISVVVLLMTGLLVSFFVGDSIILSGRKHDKKITEKTMEEVEIENKEMVSALQKIDRMEKNLEEIKEKLK